MLQVKAIKNTYEAKEALRENGFVWDKELKVWVKDFASKEEYDSFTEHFLDMTYYGRREVNKVHSRVVFEVVEVNAAEVNAAEVNVAEVNDAEVNAVEVSTVEVSAVEDGVAEVSEEKEFVTTATEDYVGVNECVIMKTKEYYEKLISEADNCKIEVLTLAEIDGGVFVTFLFGEYGEETAAVIYDDNTIFTPRDWQSGERFESVEDIEKVPWMELSSRREAIIFNGLPKLML